MQGTAYTLFQTALGTCGIAWGDDGIVALQLPEETAGATAARLLRGERAARAQLPAPSIQRTIDDITALLTGEPRDLQHATLAMTRLPAFHQRVYAIVRQIPPGHTRSYGEVAALCGRRHAARAVGQAMARNPFPIIVPCHRVLAAHGRSGGFSAHGGVTTKLRLLAIERAALGGKVPAAAGLRPPF